MMKYMRYVLYKLLDIKSSLTFLMFSLIPVMSYANDDIAVSSDPWDRALSAVLHIMTGPTATTIGAIALAGTGYLFLRGRVDIMRLMAIIAGLGLIFGASHLAVLLQQHAGA